MCKHPIALARPASPRENPISLGEGEIGLADALSRRNFSMSNAISAKAARWTLGLLMTLHGAACVAQTTQAGDAAKPECAPSLQGTSVLPANILGDYYSYGANVAVIPVSSSEVPFDQAFQVESTSGPYFYSAALGWTVAKDVPLNDLLVLTFWIKNTNADHRVLNVQPVFEDSVTYNTSLSTNAPSDKAEWVKYVIPFRATQLYQVSGDGAFFAFDVGVQPQTMEIGGLQLLDYGQVADPIPASLTSTFAYYYPGRGDANAPWRLKALDTIEKLRKASLTVKVTQNGAPIGNAAVTVDQTKSAFHWGSAIDGCIIDGQCTTADVPATYKEKILKNFNTVVLEYDLQWWDWENCCKQYALDGIAFAREHHLPVRGHALIWPGFNNMPSDTASLSAEALAARVDDHFEDEEGALKGDIFEWNVVNEPYGNNAVQGLIPGVPNVAPSTGVLGNIAIADWYSLAKSIDPEPEMAINDYNLFESKDPVAEAYDLALVKYIQANGGDVQNLGFESHFYQNGPDFLGMQATLDDFDPYIAKYGATEFDFTNIDPALQVDLMRDYMTFVFGHPKFHEFLMWGFWDGAQWLGSAPLYNLDWTLKPTGKVWQELTQQTWETHTSGKTGGNGEYSLRAFKGEYKITATLNGKTCTVPFTLTEDRAVTVKLECD
jgi:GH35 family endo-1,4-beta-xylanase